MVLPILLVIGGGLLIYCAVKGYSPITVIRETLGETSARNYTSDTTRNSDPEKPHVFIPAREKGDR